MKHFFIFCFMVFLPMLCQAISSGEFKQATLISFEGDTINGYIGARILKGNRLAFKTAMEAETILKSADEIQSVYQNGVMTIYSYTILFNTKRENVFIELEEGSDELKLFRGKHHEMGDIYVVSKNDQYVSLILNDLVSSYSFLYGDCSEFSLKERYVATHNNIVKQFLEYSKCMDYEMSDSSNTRKNKKSSVYLGPKLGIVYGKFGFSDEAYFAQGNYSKIISPKVGASFLVVISNRLSFQTDISYLNKKSSSDSVNTPPIHDPSIYSNLVEFEFNLVDVQFYVNYNFLIKDRLTLAAGLGLNYGFLTGYKTTQEANGYGLGEHDPVAVDFEGSNEIGLLLGLGSTWKLNSKNLLQFHLKYNMTEMDHFVHRDRMGGYGGGYSKMYSSMFELGFNYLFKVK